MKRFIFKKLLFLIVFAFFTVLIIGINYKIVNDTKLTIKTNTLALGDSNVECAINDNIFTSSTNLASSADPYFYSYLKLKKILRNNKIDTLLLGFAPHDIFDNGWLLDDAHINDRLPRYYPLMNVKEYKILILNNFYGLISALPTVEKKSLKNIIYRLAGKNLNIKYGGFLKLKKNDLEQSKKKLKRGEKINYIPDSLSVTKLEVTYLNKIIDLCKSNHIKLYLINTPKRKELLNYPKYGYKEFKQFYLKYYNKIDFLDFSSFSMPDDCYGDLVHLNEKGSAFFSQYLKEKGLQNIILQYKSSNLFKNEISFE